MNFDRVKTWLMANSSKVLARLRVQAIRIATTTSQAFNTIFLFGHPDQSVSSRAYANREHRAWYVVYLVVNKVFFWEDDHCRNAWITDVLFAQETLRLCGMKSESENV